MSGGYNLGTASGRIEIDGSGAERGFAVAKAAAGVFANSVRDQQAQMEAYGKTMTRNAIVGAGGFAIATKAAMGFEKQLSAISAVSGATEDEMRRVTAAALEIGAKTKFSASEAASAFEELIKAGIPLESALDGAAKATVDLAAAGEIALPRAAEIAANAMNNFKLTGKDMPGIADAVAGAANASAISVEEFAQSLSQVGAVANLAGLSFEDTAVAIAEMGNAGIKGSDAGTSLKTMLMNMIPTTKEQTAEFKRLGLLTYDAADAFAKLSAKGIVPVSDSLDDVRAAASKYLIETRGLKAGTADLRDETDKFLQQNGAMQNAFFDQQGNVKSLREIQEALQTSTKGLTREQKLASLEILFGADAIRGAAIMADNGAAGYDKLSTAMGKVGATGVAEVRLDNLAGDVEALRGSFETLTIRLGQVFLPVLRDIVQGITKVVNFFAEATEGGIEMMSKWLVFKTIGMGVTGVVITLAAKFAGLLAIFIGIRTAFGFVDSLKAGFAVLRSGGGIIKALSMVMTSTIRGSLLFRAAFKAIELVFVKFLSFGRIFAIFGAIGPSIAGGVPAMVAFRAAGIGLLAVLKTVGGRILWLLTGINKFGGAMAFLGGPIGLVIRIILGLITAGRLLYGTWEPFRNLVDGIAAALSGGFQAALDWLGGAWQKITDGFNGVNTAGGETGGIFQQIGAGAKFVADWLMVIWQNIVSKVVPAFESAMGIIGSSFMSAMQSLGEVIATVLWPALQQLWNALVEQVFPAIWELIQILAPVVGVILMVVGAIIGGLFFAFVKIVEFILTVVVPAILFLIAHGLGFLITAIAKIAGFIIQYLVVPFIQFVTLLVGVILPGIIGFCAAIVQAVIDAFIWIGEAIDNVVKWFQDMIGAVVGFVTAMGAGIAAACVAIYTAIVAWVTGLVTTVMSWINSFVTMIGAAFNAVVAFLAPIFAPIIAIWQAVFDVLWAIVSGVFNLIMALVRFAWGAIQFAFQAGTLAVVTVWTDFWNGMVEIFTPIITFIQTWLATAWLAITTGVMVFVNMVLSAWNGMWTTVSTTVTTVINFIVGWIQACWTVMFGHVDSGNASISGSVTDTWNNVMSFINGILGFIGALIAQHWNNILNSINAVLSWIVSSIQSYIGMWVGLFNGAMGWLNDITNGGFNRVLSIIQTIMGMIVSNVQNKFNEMVGFVQGIPGQIQSIFNGAIGWLSNVGGQIIEGLLGGLRAAAGGIKDFFNGLTDMIPEWKGPPKRDKVLLTPAGGKIMKSLVSGLRGGVGEVQKFMSELTDSIPATIETMVTPKFNKMAMDPMSVLAGYPVNPMNIVNEQGDVAGSDTYNVDKLIIQNPEPETASESLPKTIRKLSTVGARSR